MHDSKWSAYTVEIAVALIAGMPGLTAGYWMAWPSAAIPTLTSGTLGFSLSTGQTTTMVALFDLGNLLSPLPTSFLMAHYGRKPFLLLSAVLNTLAALSSLGPAAFIYTARFLAGIAKGIAISTTLVYLPEISSNNIRGALSSMFITGIPVGITLLYVLTLFIPYNSLNFVNIIMSGGNLLALMWVPESPYYLLMKEKEQKARSSLAMLRRLPPDYPALEEELERIQEGVKNELQCPCNLVDLVKTKASCKALLITGVLFASSRLTGYSATLAYSSVTLPPGGGGLPSSLYLIFYSLSSLIATYLGSILADLWGRRRPLFLSAVLTAFCTAVSGCYYYLEENGTPVSQFRWIPYASLILYGISFGPGLSVCPYAMTGELFPINLRNHGAAFGAIIVAGASLIINKTYLIAFKSNTVWIMYAFYTVDSLAMLPFAMLYLIETKGKSFGEIQEDLQR